MSKGTGAPEKKEQPAAAAKPAGAEGHAPKAPSGPKGKTHEPLAGNCFSVGCKAKSTRFSFCNEHYDHFKFGLIKKTGEPVSDYEKKFEHYLAHKSKRGAHKVA